MQVDLKPIRIEIHITGAVQGVGFRPFVHRLALKNNINGWVRNNTDGVTIEAQASHWSLERFSNALREEAPPLSHILGFSIREIHVDDGNDEQFRIVESDSGSCAVDPVVTPDAAGCSECRTEVFNPSDRRHGYALNTCTNCGPRYTIISKLPYDRKFTTLSNFPLCAECAVEYRDISSRRYHAETISCNKCGPQVRLLDPVGTTLCVDGRAAIETARLSLRRGGIVATKSLGGFHLIVDARNEAAVKRLREVKRRALKPFAVMTRSVSTARRFASVSATEKQYLESVQRPIVLLNKKTPNVLASSIAPNLNKVGVFLALTPLHDLLLDEEMEAVVATSANESGDAIIFDDNLLLKYAASAPLDAILTHNRAIQIGIDDSVLIVDDEEAGDEPSATFIRRSRGYAPFPIAGEAAADKPLLAFGADLKNTFCLAAGRQLYISPHIGDFGSAPANIFHKKTLTHYEQLLSIEPEYGACDLHPSFSSTRMAVERFGDAIFRVQHHHAHFASCLIDNKFSGPAIGIILDGYGYGEDGMAWGGEFLLGSVAVSDRVGHFSYVPLPGGDSAAREHDRMAVSYAVSSLGDADTLNAIPHLRIRDEDSQQLLIRLVNRINQGSPLGLMTSSAGRLIEAAAAIVGASVKSTYEGEAAARLEALLDPRAQATTPYSFGICNDHEVWKLDFLPLFRDLIAAAAAKRSPYEMSQRFHSTLAIGVTEMAVALAAHFGVEHVVLSGGVFVNRFLLREISCGIRASGLIALQHRDLPPGDGGISAGQAACAIARMKS